MNSRAEGFHLFVLTQSFDDDDDNATMDLKIKLRPRRREKWLLGDVGEPDAVVSSSFC